MDTLYFLLPYLRKIRVYRSSFAKIFFKIFPECLFSHRFLKLSAESFSLLHLSRLRFFHPGSLRELKPSCSILNDCLAVSVLLVSSSSLAVYFGSQFSISSTFISHWRALDLRTRKTTSTRFNCKCFRVFSKNIKPGKLYITIFHLKHLCGYFYWRRFSPFPVAK